jgi:hypothetical protein
MSRFKLWGVVVVVALAGGVVTAQTTVTNLFENLDKVGLTLSASRDDSHPFQLLSLALSGDQGTDAWTSDSGYSGPDSFFDPDAETSLWGPGSSTSLTGTQALFLADLDFGQAGGLVKWGAIVTAIPEPSAWMLGALGGIALGLRFLRPRAHN